jgi:hypothetical protein
MKKIIDERGRVFGKVSVIDFIVLAIVIVLGVALYMKFNVLEITSNTAKMEPITYTFKVEGVRGYTVDAMKAGDILFDEDNNTGNTIGTITDIKVSDAVKASELADGTFVLGKVEDCYDLLVTVEAQGLKNNGRFYVNKTYEVNANSERTFYTKYCTVTGTIMGIG